MSIVLQKQFSTIPASINTGDVKLLPVSCHDQRIPAYEVSLLSPQHTDEVTTSSSVQVIHQSAAVVNVIASPSQCRSGSPFSTSASKVDINSPTAVSCDRSDSNVFSSPQNPNIVSSTSSNSRKRSLSPSQSESYCGLVYQDHNYGAPLPYASNCPILTASCSKSPTRIENDDLPAKLVPLSIAQPVKVPEPPVAYVPLKQNCSEKDVPSISQDRPPPPKLTKRQKETASRDSCPHYDEAAQEKPRTGGTRCICGFLHDDGFMIQCDCCTAWQHVACVGNSRGDYFCEICKPREVNRNRAVSIQELKLKKGKVKGMKRQKEDEKKKPVSEKKPLVKIEKKKSPLKPFHRDKHNVKPEKDSSAEKPQIVAEASPSLATPPEQHAISREERKILAIMKQFEALEKRNKSDNVSTEDEERAVSKTPTEIKVKEKTTSHKSKSVAFEKETPSKAKKDKTPKVNTQKLATMLKKRSEKMAKKAKAGKKPAKPSPPKARSSSSARAEPERKKTSRASMSSPKETASVSSTSVPPPDTGKKRWLFSSETEDIKPPYGAYSPQIDSHFGYRGNEDVSSAFIKNSEHSWDEFNFSHTSVFDTRPPDMGLPPVSSVPGSPEPVLAPLKKRYARTESLAMLAVEPAVPVVTNALTSINTGEVSAPVLPSVISQQLAENPSTTEPVVTTTQSTTIEGPPSVPVETELRPESQTVDLPPPPPLCPVVEPPTKRKVSLKEYKQRIKTEQQETTNIAPSVSDNPLGTTATCPPDEAIEKNTRNVEADDQSAEKTTPIVVESVVETPVVSAAPLLDVDNDEDDILVTPLPPENLTSFHPILPADSNGVVSNGFPEKKKSSTSPIKSHSSRQQYRHRHSHHQQQQQQQQPGSDLRVIIPTKAERVAKLKRVDMWLNDVVKKNEDNEESTQSTATGQGSCTSTPSSGNLGGVNPSPGADCQVSEQNLVRDRTQISESSPTRVLPPAVVNKSASNKAATSNTTTTISTASIDEVSYSSETRSLHCSNKN